MARHAEIKIAQLEFILEFQSLILFVISLIAGCTDKHNYCSFWAAKGECKKNPGYMNFYCQKSCEICQGNHVIVFDLCLSERLVSVESLFTSIDLTLLPLVHLATGQHSSFK